MTNTEKYLDSIDGPADEDLFTDEDILAENINNNLDVRLDYEDDEDDDLDFDSNYEDERYGEGRNGMPSWSLFA